jgi:sialate O-acetylesterase
VYGKADVAYAGPAFAGIKIEANKARITFTNAKGLVARPKTSTGHRARRRANAARLRDRGARIARGTGRARRSRAKRSWSGATTSRPPVAVRYAWADVPVVNLYNDAGLPAAPFRTDDWERITEKNSFVPADQL